MNRTYHHLSLAFSLLWLLGSLLGYLLFHWDIGETIVFINLGFISFFLNYFLLLSWFSLKRSYLRAFRSDVPRSGIDKIVAFFGALFDAIATQFLLTLGFLLFISVSLVYIGIFFYSEKGISLSEGIDWMGLSVSFRWSVIAGLLFIGLEFFTFCRIYNANRTDHSIVLDWKAFEVFKGHGNKLSLYYFGSLTALFIEAIVSDEQYNGTVCLYWLFFLHAWWLFMDYRNPVRSSAN